MVTVLPAMFSLLNSPVMRRPLLLAFELRPIYSSHSRLAQVYICMLPALVNIIMCCQECTNIKPDKIMM